MTSVIANVGVPMLLVYAPVLVLGFLPIVLIETVFLSRMLGVGIRISFQAVLAANISSSLFGVPLCWLALLGGQLLVVVVLSSTSSDWVHPSHSTIPAPWLVGYGPGVDILIPATAILLTIPFFAISAVIEYSIIREAIRFRGRGDVLSRLPRCVILANATTYGLLGVFWLVTLVLSMVSPMNYR